MAVPPSPILAAKLKEGIKDAIVFLRMLEGTKLTAIVERKRKELLSQLLDLIGDSIREEPPSYEPKDSKSTTTSSGEAATRQSSVDPDKKAPPVTTLPEKPVAKQPENVATLDKKQPERTMSLDKKQPEKAATLDVKQPEKTATLGKTQPERTMSLDKKQPEKAATLDKKQPEKTATIGKKQSESEAGSQENAEHLATAAGSKASPLLGKKDKKPAEMRKDEVTPSPTAGTKGESQTTKKASEKPTATPEPQEPVETKTPGLESSESTTPAEEKKSHGGKNVFKNIFAGKKRERNSVVPPEATGEAAAPTAAALGAIDEPAPCQDYSDPVETLKSQEVLQSQECSGKLSGHLERQTKGMFGSWSKQLVVLKEDSILIDSKVIPLLGCTVKDKGATGFKLTLPDSDHVVLRAETEDVRKQWVAAVSEVITACTPVQVAVATEEDKSGASDKEDKRSSVIPQISVTSENSEEAGGGGGDPVYKNVSIKGSQECLKKHAVEMPDQRVATMKGIVNRKTRLGLGMEKRWALLTSEPCLYLSMSESSTECLARLPLEGSYFEHKKGNKSSSFTIKSGKNKETFSVTQDEMSEWKSALEVALGISSADLELASSDEDVPDPEPEDTYEDIGNSGPPPLPASPRPTRVSVASSEPEIAEDIYEECDDDAPRGPASYEVTPSLPPPRGPQKEPSPVSTPTLPPRKETNSAPTSTPLPAKVPQKGKEPTSLPTKTSSPSMSGIPARPQPPPTVTAANKKPADKPAKELPPNIPEDEVYDDIAQDPPEEDDSYYEDTAAPAEPQQDDEYVDVEHHEQGEEEGEEYVDVDVKPEPPNTARATSHPVAPPAGIQPSLPISSQPLAPHRSPAPNPKVTPAAVKNKVSSLSVMFDSSKKKEGGAGCCGQVSYKNPAKGSNYKEEWVVLEGSIPQQAVLNVQRTAVDKKPHTQLSLHDADLSIGMGELKGGAFTFEIIKGDTHHLFSVKTQEELDKWMLAIRPLVKCTVLTDAKCIYEVKEDYTPSESGDNLTLKKGTFVQVLKDKSPTVWIGQCGNYHDTFTGPIGAFPSSKVVPVSADDVYM